MYMNIKNMDIMNYLLKNRFINQRILAESTGYSLGGINQSLKVLFKNGYVDENMSLTEKAFFEFRLKSPKNAIILAAGYGMRMIPINLETPKGLLKVRGERLIKRTIKQLHEVGITDIYIVVGYLKEKYEYLIDKYGVNLIVNSDYAFKNNLHSLKQVLKYLSNSYIIPCDIWCRDNPYRSHELYSWYMVSNLLDIESIIRVNRKMELVPSTRKLTGNKMIGISYLEEAQAAIVRQRVQELCISPRNDKLFWEEALFSHDKTTVMAKIVLSKDVVEINTYEQLRNFDRDSDQLQHQALKIISQVLDVKIGEITNISVLKKGMTNRSFLFNCKNERYIMRIPGEGTERLIDRRREANTYKAIATEKISDNIIYIDPRAGYKITKFFENARTCNPFNWHDVARCMKKLREFHERKIYVEHEFNLFKQIEFYELLRGDISSIYDDYEETKTNVLSLKSYIDAHITEKVLAHIDAVPDNFLFIQNDTEVRLIDWEYAGMQDPHVDIAMFAVYSLYDKAQVDHLIETYFIEGCTHENRVKIYCYIAVAGLLWSNWCEYKRLLGIEMGEYSLRQYRFAKEYYRIVRNELLRVEE